MTSGGTAESIAYDGFGRVTSSTVSNNGTNRLTTGYTYKTVTEDSKVYETTQVGVLNNNYGGANHNLTYTYDANGNITSVSDSNGTTTYTYDSLNQLLTEQSTALGKSWKYTYDSGGNILSKAEYSDANFGSLVKTYTYGYTDANWGDLLKTFDGKALTYDGSGNLKTYNGWTYTWQGGRQLKSMTNGSTTLNFAYNDAGLRTSKNDHKYYYQGDLLTADVTSTDALYFHYDQNGSIIGFTYVSGSTTAEYYYVKNLQGDVIGILDASGNQVASYTYNAWGQVLSVSGSNTTLANRNPIRYRGYYYDSETSLYYLQSRYYNPEIGRFVNADGYAITYDSVVAANMFAYCGNNPVARVDDCGTVYHIIFGAVIGAAINVTTSWAVSMMTDGTYECADLFKDAITGAASGALAASGFGHVGQAVGNALISGAGTLMQNALSDEPQKGAELLTSVACSMGIGFVTGWLCGDGLAYDSSTAKQISIINSNMHAATRESAWNAINAAYCRIYPRVVQIGSTYVLGAYGANAASAAVDIARLTFMESRLA